VIAVERRLEIQALAEFLEVMLTVVARGIVRAGDGFVRSQLELIERDLRKHLDGVVEEMGNEDLRVSFGDKIEELRKRSGGGA
jgi:hypothetical protein